MRKILLIFLSISFLTIFFTKDVSAKKTLPRAKPAGGTVSTSRGITTLVKFRGDRLAIVVTFKNLSVASSISYTLSYSTRGTTQGASGTLSPASSADPTTREFLFGTCSHGVCRYDSGITNAKFTVTTTLKNGKRIVKSYKLKV